MVSDPHLVVDGESRFDFAQGELGESETEDSDLMQHEHTQESMDSLRYNQCCRAAASLL